MRSRRARTASVAMVLLATAAASGSASPGTPYEPLAFLVGHCWRGSLGSAGKATDEHCFRWLYAGKFVRDEHVVHGADGKILLSGETLYWWDPASRQLQYLYVESDGSHAHGTLQSDGRALVFPPARYVSMPDGKVQSIRSRWQRSGEDGYDVITEFQTKDGWVSGFKAHMQRTADPAS
jgi:hypothetical protein